jgi:ribosomal protein S18 acetylase RimI-like enzyme
VRIQLPTEKDAPLISELLSALITESVGRDWKVDRKASVCRAIRDEEISVARLRGEVIGLVHGVVHEDVIDGAPNLFIVALYVSPKYRDRGIGKRLLEHIIRRSEDKGVVEIETSTINEGARAFFERIGFKQNLNEIFLELRVPERKPIRYP